jgi:hypothetical protein
MKTRKGRPSEERRNALKKLEAKDFPHLSNITPIQRYYETADRILQMFYTALEKNELDGAYFFGRRFGRFSTDALPKHDYYKVKKKEYVELRRDNEKKMKNVIESLEHVVDMMDLEELEKLEIKRREEEAMRLIQKREEEMKKEEEERAATQALLDRLNMLDNLGPIPSGVKEKQENEKKSKDDLSGFDHDDDDDENNNLLGDESLLPMPIPFGELPSKTQSARLSPPSYDAIQNQTSVGSFAPPPYEALMQQKGSQSEFRQDSLMNLRPSSSRSISNMIALDDWSGSDVKTFTNPLQGMFQKLFVVMNHFFSSRQ